MPNNNPTGINQFSKLPRVGSKTVSTHAGSAKGSALRGLAASQIKKARKSPMATGSRKHVNDYSRSHALSAISRVKHGVSTIVKGKEKRVKR